MGRTQRSVLAAWRKAVSSPAERDDATIRTMCYSAMITAEWKQYRRSFGVDISLKEYFDIFVRRLADSKLKIPKATQAWAADHPEALQAINAHASAQALELEQELFRQRRRLADAERGLGERDTKTARENARIAKNKVEQLMGWLADLRRSEPEPRDARIFPGWFAPVIISEGGRLVLRPMRYQCRPAGKPAFYDRKFPGTYNARRDNLEGFWKAQFGHTHGAMLVDRFFENVQRDGRNVVLEFEPDDRAPMIVACLWSRWTGPEGELLSFAAITDDPPPEVVAAGHDRCIVPIKPEHLDAWLNPGDRSLKDLYAILDDRPRPYYEHRLAA